MVSPVIVLLAVDALPLDPEPVLPDELLPDPVLPDPVLPDEPLEEPAAGAADEPVVDGSASTPAL
jgi:hypothetical protein